MCGEVCTAVEHSALHLLDEHTLAANLVQRHVLALVAGGVLAAEALGVDLPGRFQVTSLAAYLMSLLVFYVIVFIFAIDGLAYGIWLALIFAVVGLALALSLYRADAR